MPCPSIIYSGRFDGAFFSTVSPWTKCYIHITVDPTNPFCNYFDVSSVHQTGYELVWLHGIIPTTSHDHPVLHVYKPFRPHHESSAPN
jgi:hypothetical protein